MFDAVFVEYDGGGYVTDDEDYVRIRMGDRRLQQALHHFQIDNEVFPFRGTMWSNGTEGSGGGVFPAEHKSALEEFFRQFYLDNPDFPQVPSKS